jgi:hypothetical protein
VADELASDPEYVEACRVAAWADLPLSETARYWRADERRFCFPDGWPDGADPRASVQARIDAARPTNSDGATEPPPSGPLSPSVQRLREMLR